MSNQNEIEFINHTGQITAIDPSTRVVTVKLIEEAECGECPAGKLCSNFSADKNVVEVEVPDTRLYKVGEFVNVKGSERLHRKAIMLATVIPSVILIAMMIGIYLLTGSQLAACLSALGAMIVFFVALYLLRNKLAHEFVFELEKQDPGEADEL